MFFVIPLITLNKCVDAPVDLDYSTSIVKTQTLPVHQQKIMKKSSKQARSAEQKQ